MGEKPWRARRGTCALGLMPLSDRPCYKPVRGGVGGVLATLYRDFSPSFPEERDFPL